MADRDKGERRISKANAVKHVVNLQLEQKMNVHQENGIKVTYQSGYIKDNFYRCFRFEVQREKHLVLTWDEYQGAITVTLFVERKTVQEHQYVAVNPPQGQVPWAVWKKKMDEFMMKQVNMTIEEAKRFFNLI